MIRLGFLAVVAAALASCISGRTEFTATGTVHFFDGQPPPPGYILVLSEFRTAEHLDRYFPVQHIEIGSGGVFQVEAFTCDRVALDVPGYRTITGRVDDPVWAEPIVIMIDQEATAEIRPMAWPRPSDRVSQPSNSTNDRSDC